MAIDVGTTKVCTLIAQVSPDGELEIIGTGVEPSRGMKKGLVVEIDEMKQAVVNSVAQASEGIERDLPGACIGVTGAHIISVHTSATLPNLNGDPNKVITRAEMDRVIQLSHPKVNAGQELIHVIPQNYIVDNVGGVRNPVGLKGHQLTVESHAVIGEATSFDNVVRSVENSQLQVKSMVLEPLASAEAVLSAEEKETGVVLVDIGGGTADLAIFIGGAMVHTAVIPVGGFQFTNDLVISLGIPYEEADKAKVAQGHAIPDEVEPDEMVAVKGYDEELPHMVRARDISRILNDRTDELLRLVLMKVKESGLRVMPPAGVTFTGGGANLRGLEELARDMFPGPVRIAQPKDILGLPEELKSPTYSTSIGILLWGIHHPTEQIAYRGINDNGSNGKGRRWLQWLAQFIGAARN
ncbi:MAG: cell division protein FtsA [Chloroflexi bacterium]|nr:MAG: cell division protein FtsA [Chloroflexota bacterium]